MQVDRLADLPPHGEQRVQRGHRLLEDHRNVVAADLLHLGLAELEEVAAIKPDRAADDATRRVGNEAQDRERGHALAATRLADHAQRLAVAHRIGHAGHGAHHPIGREEVSLQAVLCEIGSCRNGRRNRFPGCRRGWATQAMTPWNALCYRWCRPHGARQHRQNNDKRPEGGNMSKQDFLHSHWSRRGLLRASPATTAASLFPWRALAAIPDQFDGSKFQLTAPEPNPKRGGTLRYGITMRPPHFDVHQSGTINNLGAQG